MSARDDILDRVRRNQPAAVAVPVILPLAAAPGLLPDRFKKGVVRMGGKVADPPAGGDLAGLVARLFPDAKVVCSATPEVTGNRPLDQVRSPASLNDVDVGVIRAVFGIAETGSVWITDAQFKVNALGFLAQHLVVLLDPARIVGNFHDAYREPGLLDAGYGVFMTGPSATADIEGVLDSGAQGIRSMTVVLVPLR